MMIAEEESLKKRLISSLETCRKELETLTLELQFPPFEVGFLVSETYCDNCLAGYHPTRLKCDAYLFDPYSPVLHTCPGGEG